MRVIYYCLFGSLIAGCSTNTEKRNTAEFPVASVPALVVLNKAPVIGATLDAQDRKVMERSSPRTVDRMDRNEPLTINDIIKLSQGGVDDDTVINYMKETNSTYNLSQAQIRRLHDAGVSQRITNYMVDSGR